ncbi:DNA repair protein RecO, partial [Staphylococcus aureus]|uniref:DNA repair protein RecO n=1 Tax=Staphylococcus aureus TaxID=1280 RepID=UPI003D25793A
MVAGDGQVRAITSPPAERPTPAAARAGDNGRVPTYRDEAIVLRTHKLGEADRIITVLSRDHGKVRAVALGVRRTSSKFG